MAPRIPIAAALLVFAGTVGAQDPKHDEAVKRAVKGGQIWLKAYLQGRWVPSGAVYNPAGTDIASGATALAGLALIESGVPATDPVVAAIARQTRELAMTSYSTYGLSLFIMFLDRVGAKEDEPLIQFMTLRLLSGQCSDGGWTYLCQGLALDPVEARSLYAELRRGARMTTPEGAPGKKEARPRTDLDDSPKPPKKDEPPPPPKEDRPEKPPGLHPALEKFAGSLRESPSGSRPEPGEAFQLGNADHSNTQFATVALWCGRRHHVPVGHALARLDRHYRDCRGTDGGWGYTGSGANSSPAMTCAGLMGLAMGFGTKDLKDGSDRAARIDADSVSKDAVVQAALKYVGDFLAAAAGQRDPTQFAANDLVRNLYFMWSLERVGMAYGLTTIGKVDWYDWGSRALVRAQGPDGSWTGEGYGGAHPLNATAFALLYLCRANLAEDLSTKMRGKVQDPGTSRLRSPGDLGAMLGKAGKGSDGPKAESGTARQTTDPSAGLAANDPRRLADALVAAAGAHRGDLLARYRDSKGAEYTDALALTIPKLTGEARDQARDALAQRSVRFTAATLTGMMRSPDRELRRAAALAAGSKGRDRVGEFADTLVGLTADPDPLVVQAARASLKALTGEDFGPEPGATAAERTTAITAWRNWLAKRSK